MYENQEKLKAQLHSDEFNTIFKKNSSVSQRKLRTAYKKGQYTEYKCSICGLDAVWNGNPLTLNLDHIDGINNNNELNNLRWVCPNCDRQLSTHGIKNKSKSTFKCIKCGAEIKYNRTGLCKTCKEIRDIEYAEYKKQHSPRSKTKICPICGVAYILNQSEMCSNCYKKQKAQKSLIPDRDILKQQIRNTPFAQLAKQYGVSDSAIKKWCRKYNLPYRRFEIDRLTELEWEAI